MTRLAQSWNHPFMCSSGPLFGDDGRVRHRTQHGHVVDELGLRILRGDIASGNAFPAEPELCASLGVSRGALREAMKALRAKGLVDVRPGTGTRVEPRSDWNFLDEDVLRWQEQTDRQSLILSLAELRLAVEPVAARLAALRATEDDYTELNRTYELMVAAAQDGSSPAAFNDADVQFHLAVLRACHNDIYLALGKAIDVVLRASFDVTSTLEGAIEGTVPTHRQLLDAIMSHDAERSYKLGQTLVEEFLDEFNQTALMRARSKRSKAK